MSGQSPPRPPLILVKRGQQVIPHQTQKKNITEDIGELVSSSCSAVLLIPLYAILLDPLMYKLLGAAAGCLVMSCARDDTLLLPAPRSRT